MPNLDKHGYGANPVPLVDKQTLIDSYNAPFAMPNKLGYQVTYSDPVAVSRTDTTVVASAYTTSASARPQRLSNGWIVSAVFDSVNYRYHIFVDKRDGNGFVTLCTIRNNTVLRANCSITANGTMLYFVVVSNDVSIVSFTINAITQTNVELTSANFTVVDGSQTAFNGCSIVVNPQGTELHATWSSKNATYPNDFNIRYAKGTINSDGSVTWGSVEQATTRTGGSWAEKNPTIILNSVGNPVIVFDGNSGTVANYIHAIIRTNNVWSTRYVVCNQPGYAQSSPSSIFVPQSVNGLANGRIWVTWHGKDSTDTNALNLRVSYSDDGGLTWSTMQKLTSGNVYSTEPPSITADKNNNVYIVTWNNGNKKFIYNNSSWASNSVTGNSWISPSTLYDNSIQMQDFSSPLFIYKDTAKVGFYGTWNDVIATESINYSSVNLKNLVQTINSSGRLGQYANKKWASGTATSGSPAINFINSAGANSGATPLIVTGLSFIPSIIIITRNGQTEFTLYSSSAQFDNYVGSTISKNNGNTITNYKVDGTVAYINNGFKLPVSNNTTAYTWIAFE